MVIGVSGRGGGCGGVVTVLWLVMSGTGVVVVVCVMWCVVVVFLAMLVAVVFLVYLSVGVIRGASVGVIPGAPICWCHSWCICWFQAPHRPHLVFRAGTHLFLVPCSFDHAPQQD